MAGEKSIVNDNFIDVVGYTDPEKRIPDDQYSELLRTILRQGKREHTQLEDGALTLFAPNQLRYDLTNGFPLINERDVSGFAQSAFAELSAFINGARTVAEIEEYGCKFWRGYITEKKTKKRGLPDGDLGDGSYGAAYHDFPTNQTGVTFNQIKAVVDQIKSEPHLRTHMATTIVPWTNFRGDGYDQKTVWVPCHGNFLHFRIIENKLHLHHVQRSADAPIGLVSNITQYAGLLLVISKITGYNAGEYIHTISDAHIYDRQIPYVEELVEREPKKLPTALVRLALDDVFQWRKGDINITDYNPHPDMKIPTPKE